MLFSKVSIASPVVPRVPTTEPRFTKDRGPVFAVVEVDVDGDFEPKNGDTVVPEDLKTIPIDLACRFAAQYNESPHATNQGRWACVALSGQYFYVCKLKKSDRPSNADDFPPGSRTGLTWREAQDIQFSENQARLEVATVPKRWTIALRPLRMEGGEA